MLTNTLLTALGQQHFSQSIWAIYASLFAVSTAPLRQWAEQAFVPKTFQDALFPILELQVEASSAGLNPFHLPCLPPAT